MSSSTGNAVFPPVESCSLTMQYLDARRMAAMRGAAGVPLYIQGVDATPVAIKNNRPCFLPMVPGEIMSIIARPGNGKTSFMMRWARAHAQELSRLANEGDEDAARRVVVYVTLEQTVEELVAFNVAADTGGRVSVTKMAFGYLDDGEWGAVVDSLQKGMTVPLWLVGYSPARKIERLTIDKIFEAVDEIAGWSEPIQRNRIDLLFIDYLQRIQYRGESKVEGISSNLDAIKHFALSRGIPVVLGVQARRECDEREDKTPALDDGQYTSNVEQASDKIVSLFRPCVYVSDPERGEIMTIGGKDVLIQGYNQMVMAVLKQKLGKASWRVWLSLDPAYNRLEEASLRNAFGAYDGR